MDLPRLRFIVKHKSQDTAVRQAIRGDARLLQQLRRTYAVIAELKLADIFAWVSYCSPPPVWVGKHLVAQALLNSDVLGRRSYLASCSLSNTLSSFDLLPLFEDISFYEALMACADLQPDASSKHAFPPNPLKYPSPKPRFFLPSSTRSFSVIRTSCTHT